MTHRHGLHFVNAVLMMFAAVTAAAQVATEINGTMVFEAEAFTANHSPRSSHQWDLTTATAGFSGTGAVVANPNDGSNFDTNFTGTSPELQYTLNFTSTGTKYVWVRGYAVANTDDSVHAGIDGASSSAARMMLSNYGTWQWTDRVFKTGAAATINVGSTGSHTFSLWMREDGMVVDRVVVTAKSSFSPQVGNAWHTPSRTTEPDIPSMRYPLTGIQAGTAVTIYSGNQYQGAGNPGNQLQTGSTVYYKKSTATAWAAAPMTFLSASGNNKYYSAQIPANTFAAGDTVQYYLKIPYDDHLPTFLCGNDSQSSATEIEAEAQAAPFSYQVEQPPQPLQPPSGPTLTHASGNFEARIYTSSGHLELAEPSLAGVALGTTVTFAPARAQIGNTWYNIGAVVSSTHETTGLQLVQSVAATTVASRITFPHDGIMRYEVTNWNGLSPASTSIAFASDSSENFYGLGEKFNSVNQAGKMVTMRTFDQPGNKGDAAYKPVPWFLSTRGFGVHLDSTGESTFDMRNSAADRCTITNPLPAFCINIVGGPQLTSALSRYTGLTGRPPIPPAWVFGTWVSSDVWHTGGEVRYCVSKHVERDIPESVFVFDSPWEVGYNDFTWNMTQWGSGGTYEGQSYSGFSSLAEMMEFFRANGLKVVCWMTPFVNTTSNNENIPGQNTGQSANYAAGAANKYFVRSSPGGPPLVVSWWKGSGSPVDFTNPAAAAWLQGQLQTVVNQGKVMTASGVLESVIGGFKTDDGETANGQNTYIPLTATYFDGRTGREMRNGYAVEYHKTVAGVLGTSGILFARAGFTGTQKYPAGWAGDNEPNYTQENGLLSVIVSGISAGASGFALWSHDVGGYQDSNFTTDKNDLFMRWAQFGCFTPIMQMHRNVNQNLQYPWSYSAAALANYRTYAKLHSQLFPYIYTYVKRASETGLPLIMHPVLKNQTDANVYNLNHSYYFGDEIYVAPMNAPTSTSRNVYLPAGTWYDWWTAQTYTGGQNVLWTNSDTTKMPLFVHAGSIIPMMQTVPQTLTSADYVSTGGVSTANSALRFLVYPAAGGAQFTMYDGTSVNCTADAQSTTLTLTSTSRAVEFQVKSTRPDHVQVNGAKVAEAASNLTYDAAPISWRYDATLGFLLAKYNHAGGNGAVALVNSPVSVTTSTLHIE